MIITNNITNCLFSVIEADVKLCLFSVFSVIEADVKLCLFSVIEADVKLCLFSGIRQFSTSV